jgi:excisionase family DNA binding protein
VEKLLLKVPEAGELTGVGRSKAYELVGNGTWPSIRIGRSVRVPVAGLREWVEGEQATSGRGQVGGRTDAG